MDFITASIYIILFIIMMIFVFSIGMLRRYMPKKEVILVLVVAFLIGSVGGAFFLDPIYDELPSVVSSIEKSIPGNEETLYLDFSSSVDSAELERNLSGTEGFKLYNETGITFTMWAFNDVEQSYFEEIVGNIDSHYTNYTVNKSGVISINFEDNYTATQALKSFSDWYKLVYGGTMTYAQVHAVLVVDSSSLDTFEENLLERGIVASNIDGPIQDSINNTNSSMLTNYEFILICGGVGVIVSVVGIFFESVVITWRKFKKFMREKRKR